MKQVIFGLFLSIPNNPDEDLLGVMEENTFLSKNEKQLEKICLDLLPPSLVESLGPIYTDSFDLNSMRWTLSGIRGKATIKFRELNVIN